MICKICGLEKDNILDFYKCNKHICKECVKARARKNRMDNIEYYKDYDLNRKNKYERMLQHKEYKEKMRIEDPEKYNRIFHGARKTYRKKYPEKTRANGIINDMLRYGKLIRPEVCSFCGKSCEPQAHHPDYTKPTEVIWLCVKCHSELHKNLRIKNAHKTNGTLIDEQKA